MKTKSFGLIFLFILFLSCKQETKNTDCDHVKEINEIKLMIRYSMSVNDVYKRFIEIKKIDSIYSEFNEIGYGFTSNGNDTMTRDVVQTINNKKLVLIKEIINKIDEKRLSSEPSLIGFDGSFYEMKYGDGLNFKHFNFQSPYSSKRANMYEFRAIVDEILKFSPDPTQDFEK